MYNLFTNMILNEAVPRAAKSLGLNPETPPDATDPNAGTNDPNDSPPPTNDSGGDPPVPSGDIADDPDATGGGDPPVPSGDIADPGATGEDSDQQTEDPNAQDDSLQGPDMGDDMQPPDELQQAEQNLFQDLKPEQIAIKTRELKERYKDLYDMTQQTLEKLYIISKTSYDSNMLALVTRQLQSLKDLVIQSLTKSFPTRTYVENRVELEKFATIFNAITNSVQTVYQARAKRTKEEEKKKNQRNQYNMYFSQDLGW